MNSFLTLQAITINKQGLVKLWSSIVKQSHMDCSRVHNQFLSHNSKRMIKFLLSFSVLGVLYSLLPFILHSLKPFLMQFLSYYTVDKSYMFLLCNGLMVFIAMNSGLISASSEGICTNQCAEVAVADNYKSSRLEFNASEISAPLAGEFVTAVESPQEQEYSLVIAEQEHALSDAHEDGAEGNAIMIIEEEEEQQEEEEGYAMVNIDDHDHGHAAEDTEELNKKCEDFIRKMKAAFRADHSTYLDNEKSLVLVN